VSLIGSLLYATATMGFILASVDEQKNETSYTQTLNNCNYNMLVYINQTPDYSNCETQDECDLKQLKIQILQQQVFNCMNESWESR
ncbi:hypothetical protein LCGC14_2652550, partial [marine sediment metagenome]